MKLSHVLCIATGLLFFGSGGANAQSETSTLTKIKKEGVMKVCYAQGSPESYKDPKTGRVARRVRRTGERARRRG